MPSVPYIRHLSACVMVVATLACATMAKAAISLSSTRMVLDDAHRSASILVHNGKSRVLIRSWIERNAPGDTRDLPLVVSPPLAKMQPNAQQRLRVQYAESGDALPKDRESVLWLNVQEIPEAAKGGKAPQVAVRQRIKLFFRPAGLKGSAANAPTELEWTIGREGGVPVLKVVNASAYNVSINRIALGGASIAKPTMLAPGESTRFPLKDASPATDAPLTFQSINDYGGVNTYRAKLSGAMAVRAKVVH